MPTDFGPAHDAPHGRIRLNLSQREYEVEGSEAFVREQAGRLEELLLQSAGPIEAPPAEPAGPPVDGPSLGSFGEFIQRLPGSATEVDRMLAAGYFVQRQSGDDAFATADANRRLAEQGIKLGNPSQCVRQSLSARRVFAVQRGRFRVSQLGRQHLRQMLGDELVPA
jgi:hypothetical protein